MAVKLGNGNWAVKEDKLLAYNDNSGRFFNKEFDFSRGSIATYVGKDGLIKSAASDVPRIDFSDSTNGALLLEPQSTNLIPYSEDFSQWTTQGAISTTSNYGISPDGENNSTRIFFSGASQQIYKNFTSSSGVTGSIYIKGNNGETIKFGVTGGGEQIFTLNGDWQRLTTYSGSSTRLTINTFSGTARDVQIWGAQVEEQSYDTSYIPTSGSTVTRLADVCNNSGSAQDFNSEEGVLYAEIAALGDTTDVRGITLSDGSSNNRVYIHFSSDTNIRGQIRVGASNEAVINSTQTLTNLNKIALKYKANDFALWINGVEVGTDTSGNIYSSNTLTELSFDDGGGGNDFYGKVKDLQVFTEAKSDEFLAALTTI